MQHGALATDGDGKSISRETGKYVLEEKYDNDETMVERGDKDNGDIMDRW